MDAPRSSITDAAAPHAWRRVRDRWSVDRRTFAESAGLLALILAGATGTATRADVISAQALAVGHRLEALDVVHRWQAGTHVDWSTGLPDGRFEVTPGGHTHCSAFVAAAAAAFGIYILRPPQHGQILLANAQNEWLLSTGGTWGWRPLPDGASAQEAANRGEFVVASYRSRREDRPGHIAIVLPGRKTEAILAVEGPDVMQAATVNSLRLPLRDGFAGHPGAFAEERIVFFAHRIEAI